MIETNWAGNHRFAASAIIRPRGVAELQALVSGSRAIRAIGTRHSFNGIADSPGLLVDLRDMPADIELNDDEVTVSAATPYGILARRLEDHGRALANLGSLPHISVAGACAVGTHGSGDRLGNLSSSVVGIEIVTPDGELRSVRRGDPGFEGWVIGLGALGVVTRLTLATHPSYRLKQEVYLDLGWPELTERFDEVSSAGYSVSVFLGWSEPTVRKVLVKSADIDRPSPMDLLGARRDPAVPPDGGWTTVGRATVGGGIPGPWNERLPHFRMDGAPSHGDELQSEYLVPRDVLGEAVARLRGLGDRIDPLLHTAELRTIAADDLWLSPSYGRDSVGIHFTWRMEPAGVDALLGPIERALRPLGARVHWGKLYHADAEELAGDLPRMTDAAALIRATDPEGRFHNAFLERHVLRRPELR